MNEVFSFTIHVESISEILHRAEDMHINCPNCNVEFSFDVAENSDLEPKRINIHTQEAVISLTMLGSKRKQ